MDQNEEKCHFLGTMILRAKKTSVMVLIPGLFDRSRSKTVDTLCLTLEFLLASSSLFNSPYVRLSISILQKADRQMLLTVNTIRGPAL